MNAHPQLEPILPQYIDSTMITAFRGCRRKFYNEFVLGLRPQAVSIDLHAGGAFSTACEVFYHTFHCGVPPQPEQPGVGGIRAGDLDGARMAAFQAFNAYWGDLEAPHGSPKTKDNVWLAFETLLREYPPATDHVQPYFVDDKPTFEFNFAIPLEGPGWPRHPVSGDPFLYAGRYDMLGTYHGAPCFRDEKTTKQAGPTWAEQWTEPVHRLQVGLDRQRNSHQVDRHPGHRDPEDIHPHPRSHQGLPRAPAHPLAGTAEARSHSPR